MARGASATSAYDRARGRYGRMASSGFRGSPRRPAACASCISRRTESMRALLPDLSQAATNPAYDLASGGKPSRCILLIHALASTGQPSSPHAPMTALNSARPVCLPCLTIQLNQYCAPITSPALAHPSNTMRSSLSLGLCPCCNISINHFLDLIENKRCWTGSHLTLSFAQVAKTAISFENSSRVGGGPLRSFIFSSFSLLVSLSTPPGISAAIPSSGSISGKGCLATPRGVNVTFPMRFRRTVSTLRNISAALTGFIGFWRRS
mmetsp:Transcript_639/g.1310  ORF Transcript_639/g.1310 Transcript_639/m.1310 type:complete len:265 (-) Transcript_639:259-1053(-)